MRKSSCVHCVEGIGLYTKPKGRKEYFCEIDEWDSLTRCGKNYCNYYDSRHRKKKTTTKDSKDDITVNNKG